MSIKLEWKNTALSDLEVAKEILKIVDWYLRDDDLSSPDMIVLIKALQTALDRLGKKIEFIYSEKEKEKV